jgi:hypothetical protein
MKKRFYIKTALSLMAMALISSCLKNSKYAVDFQDAKPLVELPSAAYLGTFQVVGVTAKASGASPFNVPVNLAAPKPLGSALTVKLSVNQAALTAYNTANGTTYTLLPAADYSSTLSATIPAGQNLAEMVVNINTSLVDPAASYVLPLTITDGGGQQISNYNTVLLEITVKNAFDDNYTETGYKFHTTPTASHPFTGNTVAVSTVTAVTSQTVLGDLGGNGYFFNFDTNGSTVSNWVIPAGSVAPTPPSSGFMTADFAHPGGATFVTTDGSQPGTAPYVSSTYNNTYTAASKTYFMHYGYGVGTSAQTDYSRVFYIKLVGQ